MNKIVNLKMVSQITVLLSIVIVFVVGTWMQWNLTEKLNYMPKLQEQSLALTKLLSSIDISQPSEILAAEAGLQNESLIDEQQSNLTSDELHLIVDEISEAEEQKVDVLEPVLKEMKSTINGEKKVFIYHTHSREGWYGEEYESDKNANSKQINITLLGEKLAEELEGLGVGAVVSKTDYASTVPNYEWAYSYKFSKKSVKEALAANNNLDMVFDIHRDSQPRKYTTANIDGQDYAQVYFIIGKRNQDWDKNEAFAERLHAKFEELYPGLSRGIWGKNANSGNGEYNQSLHEQNVLIEVGGVENTLEENYRTVKALAHVISLIAKEDENK